MKKIKETGFGLLVIILIAALGFVGGYWYHSQKIGVDIDDKSNNQDYISLIWEKEIPYTTWETFGV